MRTIHLTSGAGNGVDKACLMTAANMLIGRGEDGSVCYCVCPVIQNFITATNDAIGDYSEELLGELYTPLIWEILGTKVDVETERKRGYYFADKAIRVFTSIALEECGMVEEANKLRSLSELVDAETANAACTAARTACTADSATNRAAVDAVVHAIYAAVHADTDAYVHAATYAAHAVYATTDAAADAERVYRMLPDIIRGAIAIGDKRPVETVMTHDQLAGALAGSDERISDA